MKKPEKSLNCLICGVYSSSQSVNCPRCGRKVYPQQPLNQLGDLLREWPDNPGFREIIPQISLNLQRELEFRLCEIEKIILAYRDLPLSRLAPLVDLIKAGSDLYLLALEELESSREIFDSQKIKILSALAESANQEMIQAAQELNRLKIALGVIDLRSVVREDKEGSLPEIEFFYPIE